jgi:hypothetical protein
MMVSPARSAARLRSASRPAGLPRLVWLHAASRRVPGTMVVLAACAGVMRVILASRWVVPGGPGSTELPAMIEGAVAAVVAVTAYNPFGESERATGRWLPWLRAGTALAVTAAAIGLLCVAVAGAALPGGDLAMIRNTAGAAGLGLLCAGVVGGLLAWIGPLAYTVIAVIGIEERWTSPWTWPARAGLDRGAGICAGLAFGAGIVLIAVRGARDSVHD